MPNFGDKNIETGIRPWKQQRVPWNGVTRIKVL